ncbi:MAG: rod shape-determining protein MreC [Alphaproteobacteria bacterium]|nr:rod shape-determining protein MreC [Alphaproteobacteria bacterium]
MPQGTFKITRGKGSGQLPLAIVAILAVILVLVGKSQSPLFDRIRADFSDWSRPVLETARAPVDIGSRWVSGIGNLFDVYGQNLRLKAQNQRLRHWQTDALLLQQRIKRYQMLLHVVPDPAVNAVTARVIGDAARPFVKTMILDAGTRNGVHPGEAVVAPSGMVGRIYVTGQRTSWVILLTDLNSRVPVRTVKGNVHAILTGDNTPTPLLDTVSDPARLKGGDQVVTSGDGGLLPANLPVGVVVKDGEVMRVVLFADPATTDNVSIVDYRQPIEPPPQPGANDLPKTPLSAPAAMATLGAPAVPAAAPSPSSSHASPPPAGAAVSSGTGPLALQPTRPAPGLPAKALSVAGLKATGPRGTAPSVKTPAAPNPVHGAAPSDVRG